VANHSNRQCGSPTELSKTLPGAWRTTFRQHAVASRQYRTDHRLFWRRAMERASIEKNVKRKTLPRPPRIPWRSLTFGHTFVPGNQELTTAPGLLRSSSARVHVPNIYLSSLRATANSGIHGRGLATLLASAHLRKRDRRACSLLNSPSNPETHP
jgi:hypothetical protein